MNERFRLNSDLLRAELERENRKQSWLVTQLGVSGSLVAQMLNDGHVPKAKTVEKLAALLGCSESDLLIPRKAKQRTA